MTTRKATAKTTAKGSGNGKKRMGWKGWATRFCGWLDALYAVILSPWLGGWLVTRKRAGAVLRLMA